MTNTIIDINADVGEGFSNEADLMPYLSSCNIACGGHAGNNSSIRSAIKLAKKHHVKIGAHPSFPDKKNFGRLPMAITSEKLKQSLKEQMQVLALIAKQENATLNHIKPHGALYNLAAKETQLAQIIVDFIKANFKNLKLYAPYKSVIANLAIANGIEVVFEAFADRNYNDDLSLISRKNEDALLTKKEAVFCHVFNMITHQKVKALSGVEVPIKAQTFCVHGDTKNALEILRYLTQKLKENAITIQ
ncbi:MAG: 5-oxoprolinase subunit PxpA [Winogradskyella sp.]